MKRKTFAISGMICWTILISVLWYLHITEWNIYKEQLPIAIFMTCTYIIFLLLVVFPKKFKI